MKTSLCTCVLFLTSIVLFGQNKSIEVGTVNWVRDYDVALRISKQTGKPIYLQFQEVPGCATCRNYGMEILSHPLLVEIIESYFVPLLIHNNKKGKDGEILAKYNEPTWNNPVSRIIDAEGKDLIPRLSGKYDMASIISYLELGMIKSGEIIPDYIHLLKHSSSFSSSDTIYLAMYCFWSGELAFADRPEIIQTIPGFMNDREVVKIVIDLSHPNAESILDYAKRQNIIDVLFTNHHNIVQKAKQLKIPVQKPGNFKPDKENKYYLYHSPYKSIPMTPIQTMRVNHAIFHNQTPDQYLSPRQLTFKGQKVRRYDDDISLHNW